jgi:hypothetical protein
VVLSTTAALAAVTAVVLYAHLKLVKWSINADVPEARRAHVQLCHRVGKLAIVAILAVALGPGLGAAAADVAVWTIDVAGGVLP